MLADDILAVINSHPHKADEAAAKIDIVTALVYNIMNEIEDTRDPEAVMRQVYRHMKEIYKGIKEEKKRALH